jgi:hypothetical protein
MIRVGVKVLVRVEKKVKWVASILGRGMRLSN